MYARFFLFNLYTYRYYSIFNLKKNINSELKSIDLIQIIYLYIKYENGIFFSNCSRKLFTVTTNGWYVSGLDKVTRLLHIRLN